MSASPPAGAQAGKTLPAAVREAQRPPKPTPIASVTPPKLPKLAAQAAHVAPPKSKAPKDEAPCGSVWTGEEEVPLECEAVTARRAPRRAGGRAHPVRRCSALPRADLPATVDHRVDGFEGRTLNQGKAGACTAFSLTSQIDHAIGLWTGKPGDVSPMEIWARYHTGRSAARANLGQTVANDADWPYDSARAKAWSQCKPGDASCLTDDERRSSTSWSKKGVAVLEEVEQLPQDETLFDVMEAKLAAGRDVGTGGKLPKGVQARRRPGVEVHPRLHRGRQGRPRLLARRLHARRRRALLPPQELVGREVGGRRLRVDPRAVRCGRSSHSG